MATPNNPPSPPPERAERRGVERSNRPTLDYPGSLARRKRQIIVPKSVWGNYEPPPVPKLKPWVRPLQLLQAISLALAVNLIAFGILYLIVTDLNTRRMHRVVTSIEKKSNPSDTKTKQKSASSSASSAKQRQQKSNVETPEKSVQKAFTSKTFSAMALPMAGLPTTGESFSTGTADTGDGNSFGTHGLQMGISKGNASSLFDGKGLGDGSELLIFLDNSRSMWRHGRMITDLVNSLFPRARIIEVEGCAIVSQKGFLQSLESEWHPRSKVFFVCDLQDPITLEGLDHLRDLLLGSTPTRELHVISFQNAAPMELMSVIRESWGTMTVVVEKEPEKAKK